MREAATHAVVAHALGLGDTGAKHELGKVGCAEGIAVRPRVAVDHQRDCGRRAGRLRYFRASAARPNACASDRISARHRLFRRRQTSFVAGTVGARLRCIGRYRRPVSVALRAGWQDRAAVRADESAIGPCVSRRLRHIDSSAAHRQEGHRRNGQSHAPPHGIETTLVCTSPPDSRGRTARVGQTLRSPRSHRRWRGVGHERGLSLSEGRSSCDSSRSRRELIDECWTTHR